MESTTYDRDQAEFNMAVGYINRLNLLFWECDMQSKELNMIGWFHTLRAIFREISDEMKEGTKEKEGEFEQAKKMIEELNPLIRQHEFLLLKKGKHDAPYDLYDKLEAFEIFLRKIIKKSGLKLKTRPDPRFAL